MDDSKVIAGEPEGTNPLEDRLKILESRLAALGDSPCTNCTSFDGANDSSSKTDMGDDSDEHYHSLTQLTNANTIPNVRICNFAEFKNIFSKDEGCYAVDVLVSGELLEAEIAEEQKLRDRLAEHEKASSQAMRKRASRLVRVANSANIKAISKAQEGDVWVQRIRLQSPALLKIFAKIQGESWPSRLRTYFRPFSPLIYFHSQVKKVLEDLEARWGSHLDGSSTATSQSDHSSSNHEDGPVDDCPMALQCLRCYVEFFDQEIMPAYTQFSDLDYKSNAMVRYCNLWYLFRTGELIYRRLLKYDLLGHGDFRIGERMWRTHGVLPCDTQHQMIFTDHRKYEKHGDQQKAFVIEAHYIEFNGEEYCVVTKDFSIPPYKGLRRISSLPVCPLRFSPDWETLYSDGTGLGHKVTQFIEAKHGSYNGWTVMRTPAGDPVTDEKGHMLTHPEHVNSEVVVDFAEAFQACPAWKPKRKVFKQKNVRTITVSDEFPVLWWSDTERAKVLAEASEIVPVRSGVSRWQRNKYVSEDAFLSAVSEHDHRGQLTTKGFLRTEDKAIITCRVYAYVFQERKWAQLDIQRVMPTSASPEALHYLRIPQSNKNMILNSIRGHMLQTALERQMGEQRMSLDFIQGKGAGLFILLHGVPGVGKTATAEAVAQAHGKPLFKITCGDLGLTPQEVESSLRDIFRLASLWDCILLLDEVDTLFSQRSKGDAAMNKNALVSVFLRVLDHYTGILFLTTNRAGALDEALKSRIHYMVYYPPLTREQTLEIWHINIQRLRGIEQDYKQNAICPPLEISDSEILSFAEAQFDNKRRGMPHWNGRQIRNAFQVARSLAYADAASKAEGSEGDGQSGGGVPSARLGVGYFQLMHNITEDFDQ